MSTDAQTSYYATRLRELLTIHAGAKSLMLNSTTIVIDESVYRLNNILVTRSKGNPDTTGWWEAVEGTHSLIHIGATEPLIKGIKNQIKAYAETEKSNLKAFSLIGEDGKIQATEELNKGGSTAIEDPEKKESKPKGDDIDVSFFEGRIKNSVAQIVKAYDKFFASGYEVVKPAGMLIAHPTKPGYGQLLKISGKEAKLVTPVDGEIRHLWSILNKEFGGLRVVDKRGLTDLAIAAEADVDSNLYFPYKLLEYAYGLEKPSPDSKSLMNYTRHSKAETWSKYRDEEVKASLTEVMTAVVKSVVSSEKFSHFDIDSDEMAQAVGDRIQRFSRLMRTGIMVMRYEKVGGTLANIKVRVMSSEEHALTSSPISDTNFVEKAVRKADPAAISSNSAILPPENLGEGVWDYAVQVDQDLATAEPLFAYKGLDAIMSSGQELTWDNLILGLKLNDEVMRAGSGDINLKKSLTHLIIAGSRAGKGVMTQAIAAPAIKSYKPLFYADCKPDIGSGLKYWSNGKCFVVNGHRNNYNPEEGNDLFGQFTDVDDIGKNLVPKYLRKDFSTSTTMGGWGYLRALLLIQGIISARVQVPTKLDKLGGENGIVVVIDEYKRISEEYIAGDLMKKMGASFSNTSFYNKWKSDPVKAMESDSAGKEVNMWYTALHSTLQDSISSLFSLAVAGLKNAEEARSDVFVLGQELPKVYSSATEFEDFPQRNRIGNGASMKGYNLVNSLSPLAIVGIPDVFFGFNVENNYLAQQKKGTKGHAYLNPKARMFAYVPNFDSNKAKSVESVEMANSAKYFKPFLIFADGSEDNYPVKFAFDRMAESGLSKEKIIARNPSDDDPTKINPAVGFREYLNRAGMPNEEIESSLAQSGTIAQFVVDSLGYEGHWFDFLRDTRPEWLFSIDNIVESLKDDKTLQEIHVSEQGAVYEFADVYPNAFPEGFLGGSSSGEYEEGSEEVIFDSSYMGDYGSEDEGNTSGQPNALDDIPLNSNGNAHPNSAPKVEDINTEFTTPNPESSPASNIDEFDLESLKAMGIPISTGDGKIHGFDDINPQQAWDAVNNTGAGYKADSPVVGDPRTTYADLSGWGALGATGKPAVRRLEDYDEILDDEEGTADLRDYGKEARKAYTAPPETVATQVPTQYMPTAEDKAFAQSDLKAITTGVLFDSVTTPSMLESIVVTRDGGLLVNGACLISPSIPPHLLDMLSFQDKANVMSHRFAYYFDWAQLTRRSGTVSLTIQNKNFFHTVIANQLGMRRLDSGTLFRKIRGLEYLNIGGVACTKENYQNSDLYKPRGYEKFIDVADSKAFAGTRYSWGATKKSFTDPNKSPWGRAGGAALGMAGVVATGTAGATAKLVKNVFNFARDIARS